MRARLVPLLLLAACGGDDGAAPTDAGLDGGAAAPVLGTIRVLEDRWINPDDGQAFPAGTVLGYFLDAPALGWHDEVARAGACTLARYTPALCDPACTDGVCLRPGQCVAPPRFHSAGRLTLTGLATPLTIDGADGYYTPQTQLPAALFADDATVTATLAGAAVPAHAITARGVPPLVAAIDRKVTLAPGVDHTVTWTPAGGDARVRLTINANNSGHGAPYAAIIECDVADAAGQITIAAALIDGFPPTSAWTVCAGSDCPPSTLRRYHRATAAIPGGDAELIVGSQLSFGVDHLAP
ncbi:MAG: hypothetical protein JNK64_19270 [Myxococcales bacterium]|nr:hypothetical protein [Myxococcales bacterium]